MTKILFSLLLVSLPCLAEEESGIPQDKLNEVIHKEMPKFRACYDRQPNPDHKLAGTVETKFTVSEDGKVKDASVVKTTLNNKPTETCVIGQLKQLVFPAPIGGGTVDVEYPFSFSQKKIH